jgi:hypothetical protein
MRYIYIFTLVFFISSFTMAAAQTSTSATTSTDDSTTAASTPTDTATPPATPNPRAALSSLAQTRLTNLAANVSNRMDAYVRRITNVTDRLESRMNKMAEEGYDIEAARTKIDETRRELETAASTLASIDTIIANFVGSENPRAYWQTAKETYQTAREAIKAAHRGTVETLLILKSAQKVSSPTGTTTEPVTDTVE